MTIEERIAAAAAFSPEMCSLNMGSMNFALHPMAEKYKSWKFDWEEPYLTNSDDSIFRNTFRDIKRIAELLGGEHGVKFEHECYDVGHLYNLAYCIDAKWFRAAGLRADGVRHSRRHRRRPAQPPVHEARPPTSSSATDYQWSVLGAGRAQMPFCDASRDDGRQFARRARGQPVSRAAASSPRTAPSRSRRSAASSRNSASTLATPEEARAMLGLKGAAYVKF